MQMNTHRKYGHGETRNEKLINKRNDISQGWQFCSLKYRLGKRKGKKREKNYHYKGDLNLVTHPSTNPAEQGLTSLSGRNMFLVV